MGTQVRLVLSNNCINWSDANQIPIICDNSHPYEELLLNDVLSVHRDSINDHCCQILGIPDYFPHHLVQFNYY